MCHVARTWYNYMVQVDCIGANEGLLAYGACTARLPAESRGHAGRWQPCHATCHAMRADKFAHAGPMRADAAS